MGKIISNFRNIIEKNIEKKYFLSVVINHSSIFKPIMDKKNNREFLEKMELSTSSDVKTIFTGRELDMFDQGIYFELINSIFEINKLTIKVNVYDVLKSIDRSKSNLKAIKESISRLSEALIHIRYGKEYKNAYSGGLFSEIYFNEENNMIECSINEAIIQMFSQYVLVDKDIYLSLKTDTAKWLYLRFSTYKKPYAYSIEKIHSLIGSKNNSMKSFKQSVLKSINEIQEKTIWTCNIKDNNVLFFRYEV